jgi:hypothetical protein
MNAFRHIFFNFLKKRHYKTDQNGIINRYFAEQNRWKEHLDNSKQYILNCISGKNYSSVAILGSGWLLDAPVDEILKQNTKIYLFDINHPKQIINRYKNEKNIEFVKSDLTNNLAEAVVYAGSFNEFLKIIDSIRPIFFNKYDFVISLNLLNQLDILLCDLLTKRFNVADTDLTKLRKVIQQKHIEGLPKNKSCIITDYKEVNYISDISSGITKPLVYVDLNLNNKKEWMWNFDTKGTYRNGFKTAFKVMAGNI